MNIGELFINLGIKGTDKTIGALTDTKKGLGEVASMSLEAKAAILGAFYAFERLMSSSAHAGNSLENFTALTGISNQTLQQYQYAARQVGLSNEEMAGSFKSVQNVMTTMRLGKGQPEGLGMLQGKVGFDASRGLRDTEYVMKKLQEYANKEHEVGMRNFVLKSFGLSEGAIAAMSRNAFRPEILKKAPTYNESEVKSLDRANAAWSNLGNKIAMAFGHFNAMHGEKLVTDLSKIVTQVVKLAEALVTLSNKLHVFEILGKVLGVAATGVGGVASIISGATASKTGGQLLGLGKDFVNLFTELSSSKSSASSKLQLIPPANPITPGVIQPSVSKAVQPNKTQNNNVQQTFHFQTDGSDHKQVGDAAQKGITRAFFQIPQGGY